MAINASQLIERINKIVAVQGDVVFVNFEGFREVNHGVYAIDITGAPDKEQPVDMTLPGISGVYTREEEQEMLDKLEKKNAKPGKDKGK